VLTFRVMQLRNMTRDVIKIILFKFKCECQSLYVCLEIFWSDEQGFTKVVSKSKKKKIEKNHAFGLL